MCFIAVKRRRLLNKNGQRAKLTSTSFLSLSRMADLAADETRETPRATSARVSGTEAKADAGRAKRTPSVWSRSIGVRQGGRWHDATTTGRLSQCRQSPSLGGAMIDWRNGRRNSRPRPPPAPGGRPVTPDWRTSRYKLQSNHIPVILRRKRLYLNNYYIYKFITLNLFVLFHKLFRTT